MRRYARPEKFRGLFRDDPEARAVYSESAGVQRIVPAAVAVPVDVQDLIVLVEWARREGAGLIPRGSGSSMSGGAVGPGVIVDLSRWKDVDESRLDEKRIIVQPGVICAEVQRIARARGLRFPVSPSSAAFCTIGGMAATNAAGAHTLAYGATREWVSAIEWISAACHPERSVGKTPAGGTESLPRRFAPRDDIGCHPERSEGKTPAGGTESLPRRFAPRDDKRGFAPRDDKRGFAPQDDKVRKNSSGYFTGGDEVQLLVGSEGTLGLFTSLELRLTDEPHAGASVMGIFASLEAATDAAIRARESGAAACELLDRTFLEFVDVTGAEAILLADAEGRDPGEARAIADRIVAGFKTAGATEARIAETDAERHELWELRHAASPILSRLSEQLKSMQIVEDGCVPPARLGEYIAGLRAAFDRQQFRGVIFGHAGDAHVHANALVDVMAPDWRRRVENLLDEVTGVVAKLGGTLAGEHGDGRLRTPLLGRVMSPEQLREMAEVKKKYDPEGILNPGVKVGAAAGIGDIKYDPGLARHPESVAKALAHVERGRAYSEFRLGMI